MNQLVFHHDPKGLPLISDDTLPVLLYGIGNQDSNNIASIGSPIVEKIKRLGVRVTPQSMDFLSIALAVTAADTFTLREESADGWCRRIHITLPLCDPDRWNAQIPLLEKAFHFLSGDMWTFEFTGGGFPPPSPYEHRNRFHLLKLKDLDCVCLFSGGMDSAIGAIDLLKNGREPLLISHAYPKDNTHQELITSSLSGKFSRFALNAHPLNASGRKNDISMRTRSCNFLAFAVVGSSAVQAVNQQESIELFMPENGFISLNAPLTSRRTGSLSTRTTHPHFISLIQNIFRNTEIPCEIINPYQFKTKGEMASECLDKKLLTDISDKTVSCSHWKRSNQQCGVCVPCLIRRSALFKGGIFDNTNYKNKSISEILSSFDKRDDLLALSIAISQKDERNLAAWVLDSGPLPMDHIEKFKQVFLNGLYEVECLLKAESIL